MQGVHAYCCNELCMFILTRSYRKKSDTWEISSMDPPYSYTTTNLLQDHRKLSSQLICHDIFPLVDKDPSAKVITIISHIITRFNYTPSYRGSMLNKYMENEKFCTTNFHNIQWHFRICSWNNCSYGDISTIYAWWNLC